MDTGVGLILAAGALTFGNEWLQTSTINWRIPIAVALLGGLDGALSTVSPKAGVTFGVIVLIGAMTSPLKGKSPIDEFNTQFTEHQQATRRK